MLYFSKIKLFIIYLLIFFLSICASANLINNEENIGLTKSLIKGIKCSKGKYIARMDQDDISLPGRLKAQYEYMEKNKNIGILGCNIKNVDENL